MTAAADLLSRVDKLPFRGRLRTLAKFALSLPGDGPLPAALAELLEGDRYRRETALFLATVAGRADVVRVALRDPDPGIRNRALATWVRTTTTPDPAVLTDAPADTRQRLYRLIRRYARTDLADALIDQVKAQYGDAEAGRLLTICGPDTVARLLPDLGHETGWAGLAGRHPDALLREATRQLETLTRPGRLAWWNRYDDGVLAAAATHPDGVLTLLEQYAPPTHLPGDLRDYGVLARHDPHRVLDLLTTVGRASWLARTRLPRAVLDRLVTQPAEDLAPLARRLRNHPSALVALLDALAPSRREALYDLAVSDVDTTHMQLGDDLLAVLPRDRRISEVRRMLALGDVADDEERTLHYTAYLPWDEAEPALTVAIRRADAEERAVGYEALLACANHNGQLARAAQHLLRTKNEQDPVRSRVLGALAKVRPSLFGPDVVPVLQRLTIDAAEARDASYQTTTALGTLAVTMLREHYRSPELVRWATLTFERLFGKGRFPYLGRLDQQLRRGQEVEVVAAVRDWIVEGMRRGRHEPLFAVTRGLHKRAWRVPELQDLLDRTIRPGNTTGTVQPAIDLWLADPKTRDERLEEVLKREPSAIAIASVWQAIAGRRTDLLDRVLSKRPKGRFIQSDVRWVPPRTEHLARWLPRQQLAYADLHAAIAADRKAPVWARVAAIGSAARVPGVGWDIATRYLDVADVNLVEAALGALPWTDRAAEALPLLLTYADGDRARVAVYAATRASRFVPPSSLRRELRLDGKVTARKEAVRLLAQLAVPGAQAVLGEAWRSPGQHRDVRAAIVSAARQRMDDPGFWPILTDAPDGRREEALALLTAEPLGVAERLRPAYAALIARASRRDDRVLAAAAWKAFPAWAQWAEDPTGEIVTRLTDLDDRSVWRSVVPAVVALVAAGGPTPAATGASGPTPAAAGASESTPAGASGPTPAATGASASTPAAVGPTPVAGGSALSAAAEALADLDARDPTRSDPERDRPARRRLERLVASVTQWSATAGPDADRRALVDAGRALARRAPFVSQAAMLLGAAAVATAYTATPAAMADAFDEVATLLAEQPIAAALVADGLSAAVADNTAINPSVVLSAAALLATHDDVPRGLFALALLAAGRSLGWPEPWRVVLRSVREHAAADVRGRALALDTSS